MYQATLPPTLLNGQTVYLAAILYSTNGQQSTWPLLYTNEGLTNLSVS